jgi:hypothetical protein
MNDNLNEDILVKGDDKVERRVVYHILRGLQMRLYDLITIAVKDPRNQAGCKSRVRYLMRTSRSECYNAMQVPTPFKRNVHVHQILTQAYPPDDSAITTFWVGIRSIISFESLGLTAEQQTYVLSQVKGDLSTRFNRLVPDIHYHSLYQAAQAALDGDSGDDNR